MGSNSIQKLSKCCQNRLSRRQSIFNVIDFTETSLTNQPYFGSFTRAFHHLTGKAKDPKFSHCFQKSPTLRSFASSSKVGFLGWYLGKLESYPLITKSITSSLIYAAADLTSQIIALPSFGSFDAMRTLRMAAYGLLILGPSQHWWFNSVSKVLPKRDVLTTLKKILMGQVIYGPCITTIFFSYNASLQGESGSEIAARLKRDLLPTLINGLLYWPICDYVTYKVIPVRLQPLVNSSCAYLWTIYLTYMASLKKVSTD
ncbi:Mpv17_PMP22 domain-containing protein [Cephalotus follicularis]|uniref:Mpv17_PMP22 domain-containing protein n=1 Tax=Cephalotus follicularis TaxID=3775 RepID=A0A1Q3D8N9_CEPFO|nr:Mpv17_PMP22 domain-containing protein [Cephalotus follicularis]